MNGIEKGNEKKKALGEREKRKLNKTKERREKSEKTIDIFG